jgi:4-hydroxy-tetrahydrodipicolinate synthase
LDLVSAICGVNVAAITPRRDGWEPNLAAIFDLIDFLSNSGAGGIALMGSTGEFVHFNPEERLRLIALSVKRSRAPVIAGVGYSNLEGAVELGRGAADAGAAAVLLTPPYFFRYSQEDLQEFCCSFAREMNGSVPIFLYNVPLFTNGIACDTAIELLSTGLFAGIKDSSGDWDAFERLRAVRDALGFTLLIGNDAIFTRARLAGADGVVSGVGCAVPELMLALDRAISAGDAARTAQLERRLQEFLASIDALPVPVGIREAVALRGFKPGPPATPLGPESRRRLEEFRAWFKGWLPDVKKECL